MGPAFLNSSRKKLSGSGNDRELLHSAFQYPGFLLLLTAIYFLMIPFQISLHAKNDSKDDLVYPWIKEEKNRMAGFRSSIKRSLNKDNEKKITDLFEREYGLDYRGNLGFNPSEGNWKPVTVRRSQINLHLSEAKGLYEMGAVFEAVLVLNSIRSIIILPELKQNELEAIAEAQSLLAQWANRSSFENASEKTDPFVFFDDVSGRTAVVSDSNSLRFFLPGSWEYYFAEKSTHPQKAVYFRHADQILTVVLEEKDTRTKGIQNLYDYINLRDIRQHLNDKIKIISGFRRIQLQTEKCKGKLSQNPHCALYRTTISKHSFFEFFEISQHNAAHFILKIVKEKDAENIIRFIAENSRL